MSSVRLLAGALAAGIPLDRAETLAPIAGDRTVVDAILELSRETGIPRSTALSALADSLDDADLRERRIELGSASATQTARILVALPGFTLVAAEMFGFSPVRFLFSSPLGWCCLVVGFGLIVCGWWWMKKIRESIVRPPTQAGLVITLAAALARSSGISDGRIRTLDRLAVRWATATEMTVIARMRTLSREYGVPIAALLDVEANLVRREAALAVDRALELLPGQLLAPVGACLFPAFLITTVVPTVAAMAGNFVR